MKIVIFSGYNPRALITFLRTLVDLNLEYYIIAAEKNDFIFNTVYRSHVVYIRQQKDIDINEICEALSLISDGNSNMLIAPSTEYLNRFLLQNRDFLETMGCVIPLCDKDLYESISNKHAFSELCINNNIAVPPKYDDLKHFSIPLIAKPKSYISSDGRIYNPIFLLNENDFNIFLATHNVQDFDFQEFIIGGESIYLLFYFAKNGDVFIFSQQNIAQQLNGKSLIAAISSEHYKEMSLVEPYIKLFHDINFRGLVMVEIRRNNENNYMIEANPRFWGPSQLFYDAKCNFFEVLLWDYGLVDEKPSFEIKEKTYYFWQGGMILQDGYCKCDWHTPGEKFFREKMNLFEKANIYKREDSMKISKIELLNNLYMESSKHSNYQILAHKLSDFISQDSIKVKSRQEQERFDYICKHLDFKGKKVLDIGGNTGFFTFEVIDAGAEFVDYYEGNTSHAEFVKIASELTNCSSQIKINPDYFMFEDNKNDYDIIINLNVIHHLGDDFGSVESVEKAKEKMIACLNSLAWHTEIMVFQMGYNWKGNRNKCLFDNGTKQELIDYIRVNCSEFWDVLYVGIAQRTIDFSIEYEELDNKNIDRKDELGEFLNRPIFIMKSNRFK